MSKRNPGLKKIIALFCCFAVMLPLGTDYVSSDDETGAAGTDSSDIEETEEDEEYSEDPDAVPRTEEEALALSEKIAENDNLSLYFNEDENTVALLDKKTDKLWWSSPVNAHMSEGRSTQIQELQSGMTLVYGEISRRSTVTMISKTKAKADFENIDNGIRITYTFRVTSNPRKNIIIPVNLTLEEDHLKLYADMKEVKEEDYDKIVNYISFMTSFGAADGGEDGYFVIPDGSGAIINFNNRKTNYRTYSGTVYGRNLTPVDNIKPIVAQNVYLPMFGIVKDNAGMMVVADKGDTCATINAYVAGQNRTSYNSCYFDFEIRTSDKYYMSGESSPLTVFEKRGILVPEIEVRYYPVSNEERAVSYIDIADKYREYLTKEKGVQKKASVSDNALYIDLFGGVMKTETFLGIPIKTAYEATSFSEAQGILSELNSLGVKEMVVNYNNWTKAGIKQKVSDEAKPAGILGGKNDFKELINFSENNGISLYPAVDNILFKSGGGYFTALHTSIRVSNAYSRQILYDRAHEVENRFYKPVSLLSPSKYGQIFENLSESYSGQGLENISLGGWSDTIYGDYGRKAVSREMSKGYIEEGYEKLQNEVGSILADGANAYVLPFTDHISNVPMSSSKFDIFDEEIPFYQIVMHGLIPYSTTPVNGDAKAAELVLLAIASGSGMHFDLAGAKADELKDTLYDVLFYADYTYWVEDAAGAYRLSEDILSSVSGERITGYSKISDSEIETVYENGTRTLVNLENMTVLKDGTLYRLSDYMGEGVTGR